MRPSTGYAAGVSLHPLAERFASVADHYERGRPEYAPAVIGTLAAELGLARGARVLDLAAGTGKLTRALLAAELDVIAVEPQAARREVREVRVTCTQPADPERIVDHMISMSWVAALPAAQRAETVARMRALIEDGETPAEMPVHVVLGLASLRA